MNIQDLKDSFKQSPLEKMKQFVLSFSREFNLDTGHSLPIQTLYLRANNLNPKQKEALFEAIDELVSEGVFEKKNDSLFLTAAGRDVLY